jgi:hypothetical protein
LQELTTNVDQMHNYVQNVVKKKAKNQSESSNGEHEEHEVDSVKS